MIGEIGSISLPLILIAPLISAFRNLRKYACSVAFTLGRF